LNGNGNGKANGFIEAFKELILTENGGQQYEETVEGLKRMISEKAGLIEEENGKETKYPEKIAQLEEEKDKLDKQLHLLFKTKNDAANEIYNFINMVSNYGSTMNKLYYGAEAANKIADKYWEKEKEKELTENWSSHKTDKEKQVNKTYDNFVFMSGTNHEVVPVWCRKLSQITVDKTKLLNYFGAALF
jgi:hypothetical protein